MLDQSSWRLKGSYPIVRFARAGQPRVSRSRTAAERVKGRKEGYWSTEAMARKMLEAEWGEFWAWVRRRSWVGRVEEKMEEGLKRVRCG